MISIYSNIGIILVFAFLIFAIGTGELYSFQLTISLIAIQIRAVNILEYNEIVRKCD